MALVLTLKPKEKIRIGDSVAFIELNYNTEEVHLNVEGVKHIVTDKKKTEILPNVLVSAGEYNDQYKQYRLLFTAPREIPILREGLVS